MNLPPLQPPSILLQGPPGSGKTDSLATLLSAGLEVFVVSTESDGISSLLDSCVRRHIPLERLHWQSVLPAVAAWSALDQMVSSIGSYGYEDLQKIKSGIGKDETRKPAMKLLSAFKDFTDERTGESFGDITKWGPDRALVIDSLSGLSLMAMALTIGHKPAAHQGEWGVAMNFIEQILLKLTSDRRFFLVLTAHVEKELNEITGVQNVMASTLGRKLAPKIPRFFSEVILAKKLSDGKGGATFLWSNAEPGVELKNRSLPPSGTLVPDFGPIVSAYRSRAAAASAIVTPEPTPPRPAAPVVPSAPLGAASRT